jgi:uncharacterized membrane-anchored protein
VGVKKLTKNDKEKLKIAREATNKLIREHREDKAMTLTFYAFLAAICASISMGMVAAGLMAASAAGLFLGFYIVLTFEVVTLL